MPITHAVLAIETDRLILRMPRLDDVKALGAIFADPIVMRSYLSGKPFTEAEFRDVLLPAIHDHYATHGFGALAMELKESGEVIGLTGLAYVPSLPAVQLGVILAQAFWRRGFAYESAAASLRYAAESLRLPRVESTMRTDNPTAIATNERLGLTAGRRFHIGGIEHVTYYCDFTPAPDDRASN